MKTLPDMQSLETHSFLPVNAAEKTTWESKYREKRGVGGFSYWYVLTSLWLIIFQ